MASTRIIKLQLAEGPNRPIIIHVVRKQQGRDLDVDLLATDGELAFQGKVRERALRKHRASGYDGSEADWNAILRFLLVANVYADLPENVRHNLRIDCVRSKGGLSIVLCTQVEDITHRLGSIDLIATEETDDVDLFGWAAEAISERDRLEKDVLLKESESAKLRADVKSLESQLRDLVKAKEDHESQLLSKFTALLNEKKFHIRNQQRVIKAGGIDSKKLKDMGLNGSGEPLSMNTKDRGRDRGNVSDDDGDDDNSEASEASGEVDVDVRDENRGVRSRHTTPSTPSTASTGSDSEMELEVKKEDSSKMAAKDENPPSPPPPPRTLPFQRKGGTATNKQFSSEEAVDRPEMVGTRDEDDTVSEDDEL